MLESPDPVLQNLLYGDRLVTVRRIFVAPSRPGSSCAASRRTVCVGSACRSAGQCRGSVQHRQMYHAVQGVQ